MMMMEECPICLTKEPQCITECGHGFCVNCVSKIKMCAICRKQLNNPIICQLVIKKLAKPAEPAKRVRMLTGVLLPFV